MCCVLCVKYIIIYIVYVCKKIGNSVTVPPILRVPTVLGFLGRGKQGVIGLPLVVFLKSIKPTKPYIFIGFKGFLCFEGNLLKNIKKYKKIKIF